MEKLEKLEIGYEQNLHEEHPYLAQPLPPPPFTSLFCHYVIKPSLPLGKGRPV